MPKRIPATCPASRSIVLPERSREGLSPKGEVNDLIDCMNLGWQALTRHQHLSWKPNDEFEAVRKASLNTK